MAAAAPDQPAWTPYGGSFSTAFSTAPGGADAWASNPWGQWQPPQQQQQPLFACQLASSDSIWRELAIVGLSTAPPGPADCNFWVPPLSHIQAAVAVFLSEQLGLPGACHSVLRVWQTPGGRLAAHVAVPLSVCRQVLARKRHRLCGTAISVGLLHSRRELAKQQVERAQRQQARNPQQQQQSTQQQAWQEGGGDEEPPQPRHTPLQQRSRDDTPGARRMMRSKHGGQQQPWQQQRKSWCQNTTEMVVAATHQFGGWLGVVGPLRTSAEMAIVPHYWFAVSVHTLGLFSILYLLLSLLQWLGCLSESLSVW